MASFTLTYTDGRKFTVSGTTNEDALGSQKAFQGSGNTLQVTYLDQGQERVAQIPKLLIQDFSIELDPVQE